MAYIEPRVSKKSGKITSYTIHVYDGYGINGKRKTFSKSYKPESGMTRKQIEKNLVRIAAQFEDECKNGTVEIPVNMRLREFAPLYLDTMKDKLSPTVYGGYERTIKRIIIPALGNYKMSEIKPIHVQKFVGALSDMPRLERDGKPNPKGEPISPSTVKRKLCVLQSMFTLAVKLGMLSSSPADSKRLTLAAPMRPEIEIFSKQEAAYILQCLEREPLMFRTLIQLAIFTGVREGEIVGLRFSDVDFCAGKLTVARSAYKLKGEPVKTKPPKSNRTRTLSLNRSCISLLEELRQERITEKCGSNGRDFDDYIFIGKNGGMMCPETPSRQFTKFLAKNDIPHRKFHSLRHTSATLLLYNGTDLKTVQERLGHADFTTTNKYLHLVEQADVDAVNSLEKLLTEDN
ncbi:MAG: site-specific integrase [Ruminococcus sp.]|nr:site-specific integrase [Ruminococcus sp.]